MRRTAIAPMHIALLAAGAAGAVEPTDLEAFVAQPQVVIEWSETVGTIESRDARLELAAIVATDTANREHEMRGARLSLSDNSGFDHLYLDEALLAAALRDLADVERGMASDKARTAAGGETAPWRVMGTERCWTPKRAERQSVPQLPFRTGRHRIAAQRVPRGELFLS